MTHGDGAHGGAGAAAAEERGHAPSGRSPAAEGAAPARVRGTTGRRTLAGRTLLMSGGSRGIGLAIALRAARDGAAVAIMAKTDQPHPKLEGTVHTAAAQIEAAGGRALPIIGDVRFEESVAEAVERTVGAFGGIDIVVNNASAIDLSPTDQLPMKKYDLMQDINARGSFLLAKTALPHLRKAAGRALPHAEVAGSSASGPGAHVLTLSPPLNLNPRWAGKHLGYTMSKYGMSLVTLGLAEELRAERIAANSLWPRTTIATAAVQNVLGGEALTARSRTPEIMADAAWAVLTRDPAACTGRFLIDEDVLREEGVTDFGRYLPGSGAHSTGESAREDELELDIFLDG